MYRAVGPLLLVALCACQMPEKPQRAAHISDLEVCANEPTTYRGKYVVDFESSLLLSDTGETIGVYGAVDSLAETDANGMRLPGCFEVALESSCRVPIDHTRFPGFGWINASRILSAAPLDYRECVSSTRGASK
jgi:hypothetical protein